MMETKKQLEEQIKRLEQAKKEIVAIESLKQQVRLMREELELLLKKDKPKSFFMRLIERKEKENEIDKYLIR